MRISTIFWMNNEIDIKSKRQRFFERISALFDIDIKFHTIYEYLFIYCIDVEQNRNYNKHMNSYSYIYITKEIEIWKKIQIKDTVKSVRKA